jgi:hypothetical protein
LRAQLAIRNQTSLTAGLAAFASIFFITANFDVPQALRDSETLERDGSREQAYGAYFQSVYEPLCAILIEGMEAGEIAPGPIGPIADLFLAGMYSLRDQADRDPAGTAAWYGERFMRGHHA